MEEPCLKDYPVYGSLVENIVQWLKSFYNIHGTSYPISSITQNWGTKKKMVLDTWVIIEIKPERWVDVRHRESCLTSFCPRDINSVFKILSVTVIIFAWIYVTLRIIMSRLERWVSCEEHMMLLQSTWVGY